MNIPDFIETLNELGCEGDEDYGDSVYINVGGVRLRDIDRVIKDETNDLIIYMKE